MVRRNLVLIVLCSVGAAILGTFTVAATQQQPVVVAQNSCADACRAAYGQCYATQQNKNVCKEQLDRCLSRCGANKPR